MGTPEFVQVPVPVDRVEDVYRLLAQPAVTEDSEDALEEWDLEMLKRFADGTGVANVKVGKMLDVMSQSPNELFTIADLVEETDYDRLEIRGALSGLTRHLRAHFDGADWMFDTEWSNENEAAYSVNKHIAELWQQVRAFKK